MQLCHLASTRCGVNLKTNPAAKPDAKGGRDRTKCTPLCPSVCVTNTKPEALSNLKHDECLQVSFEEGGLFWLFKVPMQYSSSEPNLPKKHLSSQHKYGCSYSTHLPNKRNPPPKEKTPNPTKTLNTSHCGQELIFSLLQCTDPTHLYSKSKPVLIPNSISSPSTEQVPDLGTRHKSPFNSTRHLLETLTEKKQKEKNPLRSIMW